MDGGVRAPRSRTRVALLVVIVLLALPLAAALVAWLLVDTEQLRKRLEADLSDTLSMDVQIGQPLQLGLLRGPGVTMVDVEVSEQGQVVATAESVRVGFAIAALLGGDVRPNTVHITQPELTVERAGSGELNLFRSGPGERETLSLERLRVTAARLTYVDQAAEKEWLMAQCHLDLHAIRHNGGALAQTLESLAAEGEVQCDSLSQGRLTVSELSVTIRGENGLFELEPISATAFGGTLSGRIEADLSSRTPALSLKNRLAGFEFGEFMNVLNPDQAAAGNIDLELELNAQGRSWLEFRQSASGRFSLNSGELTFAGFNLDDELEDYAETQRFNLVDVGAVFLAGPVGLIATRGYAFTGLLEGREGSTTIDQMVSEWAVEDGLAQARDVAFRTPDNRLALTGSLDFGNYSFKKLRVAVIDAQGCAVVEQQITGPFHEPEIDKPNVLVAVTGPMLNLLQRGVQAMTNSNCEAFYTGSIRHP